MSMPQLLLTKALGLKGLIDSQPAPTTLWWNLSTTVTLFLGQYISMAALLFLADSMSHKQSTSVTTATLPIDTITPWF